MKRSEEERGKERWSKHTNSPPVTWLSVSCARKEEKSRRILQRGGKVTRAAGSC